jgi:microcystin-dependent protein
MTSVLRRQGDLSAVNRPTVGDLKMSLVGVDHVGWLFCDGRRLPIAAFQQLFDVVGYSFGTDVSEGYFLLPNPQGRVLGMVGQTAGTSNWAMGDVSGSETHTLTIAELPAHNHDISGGSLNTDNSVDPSGNGRTSKELTRIDVLDNGLHSHGITDSGHTHGYVQSRDSNTITAASALGNSVNDDTFNSTTGLGFTNITINDGGLHNHGIYDPTHRHVIGSNGESQAHNNIQPTLWVGNLFVYSGRLFRDAPSGGNWFPPQGPPINVN